MQLIKKPTIDLVLKARQGAARQEVKQKDRYTDKFKAHSYLWEFETANFETQNPKMRFSISSSTLINTFKVEKPGLFFLQTASKDLLGFNLQLIENFLQVVIGQATKYYPCPLTLEVGN
jgi:hypothetical protein